MVALLRRLNGRLTLQSCVHFVISLTAIATTVCAVSAISPTSPHSVFSKLPNQTLPTDVCQVLSTRRKIDCAAECNGQPWCVGFSYDGDIPTTCVLYSLRGVWSVNCLSTPPPLLYTARYYNQNRLNWHQSLCNDSAECSFTADTVCFHGKCLYTPGFYYSLGNAICTRTCDESSLQTLMIHYPQSHINDYDMETHSQTTLYDCLLMCLSLNDCRTVDYNFELEKCFLASVTALDVPSSAWRDKEEAYYFQKTCV